MRMQRANVSGCLLFKQSTQHDKIETGLIEIILLASYVVAALN